MSVQVEITIAGGAARRSLLIERLSTPVLDAEGHRDHEEIGTYGVALVRATGSLRATFEHRYGDDVLALIANAGEALRATDRLGKI